MSSPFIQDTFTDTAGVTLDAHTPNLGGPAIKVTSQTGTAQITAAGRLRAGTAAALIGYQYAGSPGTADYDVIADVYVASITSDVSAAGPMARIQSGAQTYYIGRLINDPVNSFAGYDLYKAVSETFTRLAFTSSALNAGNTTQLKLSVRGSSITLYASTDGGTTFTSVCSATDASITAAGQAGVGCYSQSSLSDSTAIHADNLTGIASVTILPNNTAWFSSPGNWVTSSASAISTDFGAKRSILVSGTSWASLTFDLSALTGAAVASGDYPQIRWSIDGGVTTDATISSTLSLFTSATTGSHEIVYEFLRGNYNVDAYTTPVMALRETGLVLAITGTVAPVPDLQGDRMFIAGDSITAGLAILSASNPAGTDATATYAKALAAALGAEAGVAGKGGVGWAVAGAGDVPAFTTEWKNAWNGQPRTFPALKRLVVVMGTNDTLNSLTDTVVTSAVTTWLADARSTLGSATWLHVVIPFGGFKRSAINTAIATRLVSHPGEKTDCIDLGLLLETGLTGPQGTPTRPAPFDGIHPCTITHGQLGAALATAIRAAETAASSSRTGQTVGGGLLGGL